MANKTKWCKIIALDDQEVLIYRAVNETGEVVMVMFNIEGMGVAALTLGFKTEEEAKQAFFNLSKDDCAGMYQNMMLNLGLTAGTRTDGEA